MEKKYRVFIKGIPGRGKEVIKALTDLGAENKDKHCDKYISCCFIYFINHKGYISAASINSEPAKIIMDNYTELHLPEKWKDGDILVDNDNPTKFIVKSNVWNGGWEDRFKAYLFVNPKSIQKSPIVIFCDAEYHKADSEEVRQFYELLHKHGKDWDAEKKQLVDLKWKPKDGEDYWTVIVGIENKLKLTWFGTKADEARYKLGNCFKTREEAEVMAEKVKNLFLQNHEKTKENS